MMYMIMPSVTQYVETLMFCVIEELAYSVTDHTHALFEVYQSSSPSTASTTMTTTTTTTSGNDDGVSGDHFKKGGYEHLTGKITSMAIEGGDYIIVDIDNISYTPFRWNEEVILITSSELGKPSRPAWMAYGISNCNSQGVEGEVAAVTKKSSWLVYMRCGAAVSQRLPIGSKIHMYSLTSFTSYLR